MKAGKHQLHKEGIRFATTKVMQRRLELHFFYIMDNDRDLQHWYRTASKSQLEAERHAACTTIAVKLALAVRDFLLKKGVELSEIPKLLKGTEIESLIARTVQVHYWTEWKPQFIER